MTYFIDTKIYSQGKACPPRRVPLYGLTQVPGQMVTGKDIDGNQYILPLAEICHDTLFIREDYPLELYRDSFWIQEHPHGISVFLRDADGDFRHIGAVAYSEKDHLDDAIKLILQEARAQE